jgi:hypothetical protein
MVILVGGDATGEESFRCGSTSPCTSSRVLPVVFFINKNESKVEFIGEDPAVFPFIELLKKPKRGMI